MYGVRCNGTNKIRKTQNTILDTKNMIKKILFIIALAFHFLAAPLYSTVIDNMDTLTGWTGFGDGTISLQSVIGNGKAVQATYDLSGGDWVQLSKTAFDLHKNDFSGGDSLSFYYRGEGDNNNIELKIVDSDGDIFVKALYNVTDTNNVWSLAVIPLTDFGLWTKSDGSYYGNGTINWNNISKYFIGITASDKGTGFLEVDEFSNYQASTDGNYPIDDCKSLRASPVLPGAESAVQTFAQSIITTDPSPDAVANPSVVANNHLYVTYISTVCVHNYLGISESIGTAVSSSAVTYLNFYMKLGTGEEKIHLEFVSTGGESNNRLTLYPSGGDYPATTEWQFFSIPLTAFGTIPGAINEVKWIAEPTDNVTGITRSFYLDRIWLSTSKLAVIGSGPISVLNAFEDSVNKVTYPTATDLDSVMDVSSVDGVTGKAVRFDYDFKKGSYMLCEKSAGVNTAVDKGFRFRFKGTGYANNIEFKVKDGDNVEFAKKFYNFTNTSGEWKTATVLMKDLTLFTKGNDNRETLDLKNVAQIGFAISKSFGGKGTFVVDDLETISDKDFQNLRPGRIISDVQIDNNPFSPNGDGIKDLATFSYTLTDFAHVWFDIFNMAGEYVRKIDIGEQVPGTYSSLQWDGRNDSGEMMNNGLYFYKLRAKNTDNQSDFLTHVIAVIK